MTQRDLTEDFETIGKGLEYVHYMLKHASDETTARILYEAAEVGAMQAYMFGQHQKGKYDCHVREIGEKFDEITKFVRESYSGNVLRIADFTSGLTKALRRDSN